MRAEGLDHIPVVVGGIIPDGDALILKQMGVARIYTPKDFKITEIMGDVVRLVEQAMVAKGREQDVRGLRGQLEWGATSTDERLAPRLCASAVKLFEARLDVFA